MADTITMPKLGFDMAEGTLVRWVKAEGDTVNKGDVIAEIETDKATVEVDSSFSGVMVRQMVEKGAVVPVGTPIAIIAAPGERVADEPAKAAEAPAKAAEATARAAEAPAPAEKEAAAIPVVVKENKTAAAPISIPGAVPEMVKASPLAKRIAHEFGIALDGIAGSGPGGRIVRKDIEQAAAEINTARETITAAAAEVKGETLPVVLPEAWSGTVAEREVKHIPLSKLHAAIARRMVESKHAPHFYITHDYDMAALMKLRKEINEFLPEAERLSVNDFVVKAVGLTLRQFPNINAAFKETEIMQFGAVNIGVAVALENGLMTVVSKDTDLKPLRTISGEIKAMAARARAGKVKPEDIEGSTFSISNLGMFDVENFAAIINTPEAAILAVSSVRQVPVVVDGNLAVGTRMKATLSADHRVTDGAEAAKFMQKLAVYLEKPASLVI
ncbi:MAG TPA: dihydrolipoamide acetyltransferase family protein [Leptolinea sp.]